MSKSQAFFDANKRMAVITTGTFLKLNGYKLDINEDNLRDISILLSADEKTNIERPYDNPQHFVGDINNRLH